MVYLYLFFREKKTEVQYMKYSYGHTVVCLYVSTF